MANTTNVYRKNTNVSLMFIASVFGFALVICQIRCCLTMSNTRLYCILVTEKPGKADILRTFVTLDYFEDDK